MSNPVILIADDDEHVLELLSLYLGREGFALLTARRGDEALQVAQTHEPDLIILDIMMPGMDGWEVCRELRKQSQIPIIMLSARDEDLDKILGLELGADDYVAKPFNPREVVARVKAVLRRTIVPQAETKPLVYPRLSIDLDQREVRVNGDLVALTPKEMELLWVLAANPGRVYSREQLLEQVWGYEYFGDTRTVDTHIKRLRKKLGSGSQRPWEIRTVWGAGYKFELQKEKAEVMR